MSKTTIQLGRLGDIVTILPLLYADYQRTGEKQRVMVAKEFASILEGCSYIEPVIFDGDYKELGMAVQQARGMTWKFEEGGETVNEVVVTSIHGSAEDVEKYAYAQIGQKHATTESFQKEAWKLAGRLADWDECLPLVFDRRDKEREDRLLKAHGFKAKGPKKPVILLAIDGGVTAPFPHAALLRELVTLKFGQTHRILDLPMVEKPDGRIYDLLALYEKSALLIAIDSMPLHLAWACRELPVFALAQGQPSLWHGSAWRPNHLWFCRYQDWPERAVEMIEELSILKFSGEDHVDVWFGDKLTGHGYSSSLRITKGMCSRNADAFPFVKDVIQMALQRCMNFETLVQLSRDGMSYCHSDKHPSYAYRIQKGQFHPIVDMFSAPKSFWKQILPEIPDLILDNGDVFWSQALMAIFKKHGAVDATGCCEFVGGEK